MRASVVTAAASMLAMLWSVSASAADADWKADWERTVAAANREGELAIAGPSGRGWRDFLTQRFAKEIGRAHV